MPREDFTFGWGNTGIQRSINHVPSSTSRARFWTIQNQAQLSKSSMQTKGRMTPATLTTSLLAVWGAGDSINVTDSPKVGGKNYLLIRLGSATMSNNLATASGEYVLVALLHRWFPKKARFVDMKVKPPRSFGSFWWDRFRRLVHDAVFMCMGWGGSVALHLSTCVFIRTMTWRSEVYDPLVSWS